MLMVDGPKAASLIRLIEVVYSYPTAKKLEDLFMYYTPVLLSVDAITCRSTWLAALCFLSKLHSENRC